MSVTHRVITQGECLSSIAREVGLTSWKDIYNHSANAEWRKQRPNPNIVFPGDRIFVPDASEKAEQGATEQRHRFRRRQEVLVLNLRLLDEGWQPLAGMSYKLVVGLDVREGVLDGDGRLQEQIPVDVGSVNLEVVLDVAGDTVSWCIDLKGLDPLATTMGVQERLNNLALKPGPIDGIAGPVTEAAVRRFQSAHSLEETGTINSPFLKKLEKVYGS